MKYCPPGSAEAFAPIEASRGRPCAAVYHLNHIGSQPAGQGQVGTDVGTEQERSLQLQGVPQRKAVPHPQTCAVPWILRFQ